MNSPHDNKDDEDDEDAIELRRIRDASDDVISFEFVSARSNEAYILADETDFVNLQEAI